MLERPPDGIYKYFESVREEVEADAKQAFDDLDYSRPIPSNKRDHAIQMGLRAIDTIFALEDWGSRLGYDYHATGAGTYWLTRLRTLHAVSDRLAELEEPDYWEKGRQDTVYGLGVAPPLAASGERDHYATVLTLARDRHNRAVQHSIDPRGEAWEALEEVVRSHQAA